ncbi:SDR family NAD(P)-dependent oxidoreductase, partial [Actinocrinis puniceicyclus]
QPSDLGLTEPGHPLLGAQITQPDGTTAFTGRLSQRTHPWLADHTITGTVLLPGTALLDLALHAAHRLDYNHIDELTLQAPLLLPENTEIQIHVTVAAPDHNDHRRLDVHSRPHTEDEQEQTNWTHHATATLTTEPTTPNATTAANPRTAALTTWPPTDAQPLGTEGFYDALAEQGYEYGPTFQGMQAAWKHGETLYAEVNLPQDTNTDGFGIHPALLDAALHTLVLNKMLDENGTSAEPAPPQVPFSFSGVTLHAADSTTLRVRLSSADGNGWSIIAADTSGAPVITVEAVAVRAVTAPQTQTRRHPDIYQFTWPTIPTPAAGAGSTLAGTWAVLGPDPFGLGETIAPTRYPDLRALREAVTKGANPPDTVFVSCFSEQPSDSEIIASVHQSAHSTLALVQDWLSDDRFETTRLALVTRGAVATDTDEDVADLRHAPIWGLIRSAQSENPGRFVLIDLDSDTSTGTESADSSTLIPAALAAGEPYLAVREAELRVPRLAHADTSTLRPREDLFDPEGTVLVTGATGTLGTLLVRHLATRLGAKHLLLLSRRGIGGPGAAQLHAELTDLGVDVRIEACDAADRGALAAVLAGIPAEHPLSAVIHTAGVLKDATLGTQTPEHFDTVLRPKADAAWNLHELTRELPLKSFVIYSSAAGILGTPGQANYATANTFLDALAHRRRAAGLPAISLAWDLWEQTSGISAKLSDADRSRIEEYGVRTIQSDYGLELFDTACASDHRVVMPSRLDKPSLRKHAENGTLPAVLRGLVRVRAGRSGTGAAPDLRAKLAALPEADRPQAVLDAVLAATASVLGYTAADDVDDERGFLDLGFDSLTAVELRNRLGAATGLRLPTTLVFDHPTPAAMAVHLAEALSPEPGEADAAGVTGTTGVTDTASTAVAAADLDDAAVTRLLAAIAPARLREAGILDRLLQLSGATAGAASAGAPSGGPETAAQADSAIDQIDELDLEDLVKLALDPSEKF